jgi:hypothetical protein
VPSWLRDGALFGESGISLELDRFMVRVARLQHEAYIMLASEEFSASYQDNTKIARFKQITNAANELDEEMLFWTSHPLPEWLYQTQFISIQSLRATLYGETIHVYSSVGHAAIWNLYRTTHIILKRVMIELLQLLSSYRKLCAEASIDKTRGRIQDLIGDVCASIPYTVSQISTSGTPHDPRAITIEDQEPRGKVTASMISSLAFPLHVIIEAFPVSGLTYSQQQWIRAHILRVGQVLDDRILETVASS